MAMNGYTKLFNSILASTIWRADDHTRLVWITMLAMADKHGVVEASIPGLADFARVPLEACQRALEALSGPDEFSRTKESDGRRIEPVDGGWRLLNHRKYREKLGADERREYLRVKQREYREKKKRKHPTSTTVNNVSDPSTRLTHTEADTDTTTEASSNGKVVPQEREKASTTSATQVDPSPNAHQKPISGTRDPFLSPEITERAGRFIERYQDLYTKHRKGARYVVKPARDYDTAVRLCETWKDDRRLDKLAAIFLTTDHKFAEEGSRTIPQFAALASWCDSKLADWEEKNGHISAPAGSSTRGNDSPRAARETKPVETRRNDIRS